MRHVRALADMTLRGYFAKRREETPESRARSLLPRITLGKSYRWRSDDLRGAAESILAASAFDVDDLAENYLNVSLTVRSLEEFDAQAGSAVFGLAYPDSREIVICPRAENYLPLHRTTVAHELGHILLHGSMRAEGCTYSPAAERRPRIEREADAFMLALLIPTDILVLAVAFVAEQSSLDLGQVLGAANSTRSRTQWRRLLFRPLMERLHLSRLLLCLQLQQLGYFSEETTTYHQSYALETKFRTATQSFPLKASMDALSRRWLEL